MYNLVITMRLKQSSKVFLFDQNEITTGNGYIQGSFIVAVMAWVDNHQSRFHQPIDIQLSKFITDDGKSDEELSELLQSSYNVYSFLDKLLLPYAEGVITDIAITVHSDTTTSITITGYGG